ncbi:cardiolipin synthase [Bacillaceae bacterium W0354]
MWPFIAIILLLIIFFLIGNRPDNDFTTDNYPNKNANISFFWNGKKLFDQFFKDIHNAKHYVCISFYIIRNDSHGERFLQTLKEKSEAGVQIYLLADRIGSLAINRKIVQQLKTCGVHFSFSNKFKLSNFFHSVNRRNHRKIAVIDGEIAYVGGYNIGDEYVNDSAKFAGWRDYHVRLTGEVVQDMLDLFCNDWEKNCGEQIDFQIHSIEEGSSPCRLVPTYNGSLESVFVQLINQAQHSIKIGTPYFIPSEKLLQILLKKLKDGVEVTILYPHEPDHPFVKEASIPYIRKLQRAGANVLLFTKGFYHAKILFVDDKIVDIGTANFDRRSLFINNEVNLLIFDPKVINELHSYFLKDLDEAMPLNEDWMNHPNRFIMMLKRLVANVLKPLL